MTGHSEDDDEVKAFSLDENFDYENIVLTPKFSPAEFAQLVEIGKKNSYQVAVPFAAVSDQVGVPLSCDFTFVFSEISLCGRDNLNHEQRKN